MGVDTPRIGNHPISFTAPRKTRAPRALAMSWAPRHTPSTGNISSDDIPDELFLGGEPGQGRLVVDAHGTPQGNQHIDTVERW